MSLLAEKAPTRTYAAHAKPWWQRTLMTRDSAIIALLVVVWLYASIAILNFSDPITVYFLVLDIAPILLIALPMTLIIITGEIDLSVASVVGLSSVLFGVLHREGLPMVAAMVIALLACAVAGALNGVLVTRFGLPSLAVTIGTMALFRGIAVGALGTTAITDWPDSWGDAVQARIGGSQIPLMTIPLVVLILIFAVILHFTPFGRGIFAAGLSKDAARFSGVNVDRTKLILFTLSGLVSGLAGIYFTLRYGSARGDNATGLELQVVAAVLLGGVSIFGGRGAIPGVIAGVVLIGTIGSALRLDGLSANIIQIITGVLLIAAVIAASVLGWTGRIVGTYRRQHSSEEPSSKQSPQRKRSE
ncbi:MAG TPA: ABC transporter permease [Nocardioides sp.]